MALTQSTMMKLGSKAPDFKLLSSDGEYVTLSQYDNKKAIVILFICNHCPYVIHIAPALASLADEFHQHDVQFIAVNSNDTDTYPADNFDNMKIEKAKRAYNFPYLFDETQAVAKAYEAACTPDIYVFNQRRELVYRGQFDDTRPHRISSGNYDSQKTPATGSDLSKTLQNLLDNKEISDEQIPSMGCNIKWIEGNEPDYYG